MMIANMISARNCGNLSHTENRIGYHKAGGHPKCDKFIKMSTTNMKFDFNQTDMRFNHKLYLSIYLLFEF